MNTLLLDVGAGTLDLLWQDATGRYLYKAVAASPLVTTARRIESSPGPLLVCGREMGGGPVSRALVARAREQRVVITMPAAATVHGDHERVRRQGLELVTVEQAAALEGEGGFTRIELADIERERILGLLAGLGVAGPLQGVGICLQDHGRPPPGISSTDFRHRLWVERLEREPRLERLLMASSEIPSYFGRLRAAAADAALLPGVERIWVMDSGMAALLGGWQEAAQRGARVALIVDVATSHTAAGLVEDGRLCGFFELHTKDLELEVFDTMLDELEAGRLEHQQVLERGGHGAWQGPAATAPPQVRLLVGPRRELLAGSRHSFTPGAPLGDNMMAGCAGLLAAIREVTAAPPSEPPAG